MRGKIFINYRREGTAETAGRLYDRIAQAFGHKNLFVDLVGVDLKERLKNQVPMCQAFLTIIGPGWLDALLPHFADPAVGAVAPRIVPDEPGSTWLARYEGASSTLDMGARASIVRPGSRVPYVPGAALVVRRAAAGAKAW